jgi:UPF0716 protein FxsA
VTAGPAPTRRRHPLRWLLLVLALLPVLEVLALVAVGRSIGVGWTLVLLLAMAVLGAWLARRETGRTFRSLQRSLESGRMPTDEATDAILVMLGGFLLILPGFLTDVVGLVLVLPFTRPAARRLLQAMVAARLLGVGAPRRGTPRRPPGQGQVIEGEVVSETPPPGTGAPDRRPLER